MISFNVVDQILDGSGTELLGLSDVDLINIGGDWTVVVTSAADSAITTFAFDADGVGDLKDSQSYDADSGTRTSWAINSATIGGTTVLFPATRYEDQAVVYSIGSNGMLSSGTELSGMAGLGLTTSVTLGGSVFVYAQNTGGGVTAYGLDSSLALTEVQTLNDSSDVYLGDVSGFASATVGGSAFLFVISAFDAGVSSYSIGVDGKLILEDTVTPEDYSGFSRSQALLAVEVDGTDYLVMAAAGTSSLTVYGVGSDGSLTERDHLIDTLDTRFQGASALDGFVWEGRQFIVAAGSDDGITLLELKSTGQLWDHGSLADTYDSTLDNISGLSVEVVGGKVAILVSSDTDHGFTHIELDMSDLDEIKTGTDEGETISGTSGADVIDGKGGNDKIIGKGGSDILIDGEGADILIGDGGPDVFQFVEDGRYDEIRDFDHGYDTIDLSAFDNVFGMNDLSFLELSAGLMIYVNSDVIFLRAEGDETYRAADFGVSDFEF